MAEELRVASLVAKRSQKVSGFIPVPGIEFQLPVTLVNGREDGPRVTVTGGIHGAEYPGIEAAIRLGANLDPSKVKGSIIVVHVSNPPAFFARSIYVGPMDGKNLNRVFPGDPDGTASDKIAHALFTNVIKGSDYYMDLHGGDMIEKLIPFTIFCGEGDAKVEAGGAGVARGLAFDIPIEQNTRPGLKGRLRIEARPWS